MIRRFFSATTTPQIITVTEEAWEKIKMISTNINNNTFIFSATSGGCNGFNYMFNALENKEDYKKSSRLINNNIEIVIDPLCEFLLMGTTIDYIKEDLPNGIFENKFVFLPDKSITTTCGCGVSFTPK